jgi:hypothetical protein
LELLDPYQDPWFIDAILNAPPVSEAVLAALAALGPPLGFQSPLEPGMD